MRGALFLLFALLNLSLGGPSSAQEGLERGVELFGQGAFERAVLALEEAVREEPKSPDAWFWLGRSYEALGHYARAQECYNRVLALDPLYPPLRRALLGPRGGASEDKPETPSILAEAKSIAVLSRTNPRVKGRGDLLAEAVAAELRWRLSRAEGLVLLDERLNPGYEEEADLLVLVEPLVGAEGEERAGVWVSISDPLSGRVLWSQGIWPEETRRRSSWGERKRLSTLAVDLLMAAWSISPPLVPERKVRAEEERRAREGLISRVVMIRSPREVIVEGGLDRSFSPGMKVIIYREGRAVVTPGDGRKLGYEEITVAQGTIHQVRERFSYVLIEKAFRKDLKVGDKVVVIR